MTKQFTQKKFKAWSSVLKWLIAGFSVWFIYHKTFSSGNRDWWIAFRDVFQAGGNLRWLVVSLALMPVNWFVEALKWRFAMRKLEQVSVLRALEAVFSGLTFSIFTPNRIGEYAGRIFVLRNAGRVDAVLLTVMENFSQLVVTVLAGTAAAYVLFPLMENISAGLLLPLNSLLSVVAVVILILYFNSSLFSRFISVFPVPERWKKHGQVFSMLTVTDLAVMLGYSSLRYAIFSFQFYSLIRFFGVDMAYSAAMACIALVYYSMALIPTITLTELGVRGGVAVGFFALVTDRLPEVVFASSVLWMINLVVPALIGSLLVFDLKFFRQQ